MGCWIQAYLPIELSVQLGQIFYFVVLPVLVLAGVGYAIQRWLGLEMITLARLNFYLTAPGMIYVSVVNSQVTAGQIGRVVFFCVAMIVCLAVITLVLARVRRIPPDQIKTALMTTVLYNSGNYGLPLQDLAFRNMGASSEAFSLQIFSVLVQNFTGFTLGVYWAARGRGNRHWKQSLIQIARFPSLYALAAALITVQIRGLLVRNYPMLSDAVEPFWYALDQMRYGYIPLALCTLGAQLALIPRGRDRYPVKFSVLIRLVLSPIIGLGLIYLLGIRGFEAQVLLIGTAVPSAVNCALLCVQFDNHPNYAARAVLYSTLLSPLTVTGVILFAQGGFLDQLRIASGQ